VSAVGFQSPTENGIRDFKKLDVWQRARRLNKIVYSANTES